MKERNHAFDFLCGLCILRMVMLHAISVCGLRGEFWFGKLMAWTFFFMSFFFFKAGYFNKGRIGDFGAYVKDRCLRLLVPYLVWGGIGSAVYFGFLYFVPRFAPTLHKLQWDHVWTQSHFWGNPPCWFLFSFFTAYIIIGAVRKLGLTRWFNALVITFPFISYWLWKEGNPLWMSLNNVFMGLAFFTLGQWWRQLQDKSKEWRHGNRWLIALSVVLICTFMVCNKLNHGEYDMSLNKWVQHPWGAGINTVCALVGFSGLLLSLPQRRIPIINYIGEHSMVFFVAHYPLIFFYQYTRLTFRHGIRGHWDDVIVLLIFIFVTCTWLVPYVESVNWLSGRIKKK